MRGEEANMTTVQTPTLSYTAGRGGASRQSQYSHLKLHTIYILFSVVNLLFTLAVLAWIISVHHTACLRALLAARRLCVQLRLLKSSEEVRALHVDCRWAIAIADSALLVHVIKL